jgi:endonuclease/exonuclease/phosphatase family metal-dependent hydrolase
VRRATHPRITGTEIPGGSVSYAAAVRSPQRLFRAGWFPDWKLQDIPTAMQFRVITYNIHKGIGGIDRRYRPERIVETLTAYKPDIVLLQEVDDMVPRSRYDCQVELFADALDMKHHAFQRNVHLKRGHYGNAILSHFPLTDVHNIDLTIPLKKRRRGLFAHCKLHFDGHTRTLLIGNVHLGLAGFERTIQLKRILDSEIVQHTHRRTPMIIAGDYNDVWGTIGKRIMLPAEFAAVGKSVRTFPAAYPVRCLDRVFFRGDLDADHAFASRSAVARQASDHLPLIVDFKLLN